MIKKLLLLICLSSSVFLTAQEENTQASVEKNQWGVTIGLVEAKLQNEIKLARKATLRLEAGVDLFSYEYLSFESSRLKEKTGFLFAPTITAEPMFYYNIDRRKNLEKNTNRNSGNYFSLRTLYGFTESELYNSNNNIELSNTFVIAPKYGIKRAFGKNFFYEFGFGLGWIQTKVNSKTESNLYVDISTRIGINF
ncbi:hypothetical protein [Pseudofulvibacter geojedonensis]|uniref:Outer membrane protein beta-barrel domain-containing protein n=1 Tax=Pseudofulvibacter geojedonensis TaxID=1123758 RepID=A0ABW3I3X7_9FLAO